MKEMKAMIRDSDFKLSEQIYEMREVIIQKDKIIDDLKQKHNEQLKRIMDEDFKK
jgi:hypothetical protein